MDEVPFDDRRVPRAEIDWERSLWWWYPVTRAIHPASRITSLIVASMAILLGQFGLSLGSTMFSPRWSSGLIELWSLIDLQADSSGQLSVIVDSSATNSTGFSYWVGLVPKTQAILNYAGQGAVFSIIGPREVAYLTFIVVWMAVTVALGGGILARRSVVELGQRTIAPWGQTVRLVLGRWSSYLWASGMSLVGLGVMLVIPLTLGAMSRVGWLSPIAGVLFLLAYIPLVFCCGRLLFGAIACYPLSVCAISTERKADAFEGFSRSTAYLFQRPVVVVMLTIGLLGIGWVGYQLLFWIIAGGWYLTRDVFLLGAGTSAQSLIDSPSTPIATNVVPWVVCGTWLSRLLLVSFGFSFFWSASAAVYLIVRKCVDQTELDDMDSQEPEVEQPLPEVLPPTPPADSLEKKPEQASG